MRGTIILLTSLILALGVSLRAPAVLAQNLACGIDCRNRTFTSCNDSAMLGGATISISCSASQGSCQGETFCATLGHQLPSSAFPLDISEIILVAAGAAPTSAAMPFDLQVFEERGNPSPGAQIGPTYNLSIPGSQSAAIRVDLNQGGLQPIRVQNAGTFRVCLRKHFNAGHNVCLDTNGNAGAGRNWAFVSIAANPMNPCGTQIIPARWYSANAQPFPGLQGDFILRAKVRPASLQGVPGFSDCGGSGDAGVSEAGTMDGGSPTDAESGDGPVDAGRSMDTGAFEDGGPTDAGLADLGPSDVPAPEDGGKGDGGSARDASLADTGLSTDDAGQAAPPEIAAVTPREGPSGQAIGLTITGRGFQSGLTASLNQIPLIAVSVTAGTTIRASVPAGVADGVYDLIVTNPDGQAAVRPEAFRVGSASPETPAVEEPSGCVCTAQRDRSKANTMSLMLFLLIAVGLLGTSRSPRG